MNLARSDTARWVADAYSATGQAWERGPGRIYNRMAQAVVERAPIDVRGRLVCDVGAGTGAASRALLAAGARVIAGDVAAGMLLAGREHRPPAALFDAYRLPLRGDTLDGVVAAFSFNHLAEPAAAFREANRATRPGGMLLVAVYGLEAGHPAKEAVEDALSEAGWRSPDGYLELRASITALLSTPERLLAECEKGGVRGARVEEIVLEFPELGPLELVEWRLGMAQHAPFFASLDDGARRRVVARALELVGERSPVLQRPILVLSAVVERSEYAEPGGRST